MELKEFIKGLKKLGWLRTEMQSFSDEALEKQWKDDHYVLQTRDEELDNFDFTADHGSNGKRTC